MSENSTTAAAEILTGDESRRIEIYVNHDRANEILRIFEVPMPDAADIDEIRLIVRDSAS